MLESIASICGAFFILSLFIYREHNIIIINTRKKEKKYFKWGNKFWNNNHLQLTWQCQFALRLLSHVSRTAPRDLITKFTLGYMVQDFASSLYDIMYFFTNLAYLLTRPVDIRQKDALQYLGIFILSGNISCQFNVPLLLWKQLNLS